MTRPTTQGHDRSIFADFKRALRRFGPFGTGLIVRLETANPATREMCARYAEQTARRIRRDDGSEVPRSLVALKVRILTPDTVRA